MHPEIQVIPAAQGDPEEEIREWEAMLMYSRKCNQSVSQSTILHRSSTAIKRRPLSSLPWGTHAYRGFQAFYN